MYAVEGEHKCIICLRPHVACCVDRNICEQAFPLPEAAGAVDTFFRTATRTPERYFDPMHVHGELAGE